jgi:hypothetical protein
MAVHAHHEVYPVADLAAVASKEVMWRDEEESQGRPTIGIFSATFFENP